MMMPTTISYSRPGRRIRMSAVERRMGRFMRGPEGHEGDTPSADGGGPADTAPPADPALSDETALGGKGADPADLADPENPEGGEPKPGDEAPAGPPETYEIKPPEGMELDGDALALAEPVFRDLGLTNDQAQKLTDAYVQISAQAGTRAVEAQQTEIATQRKAWLDEAKADPEIGGAQWDASLETAGKALDRLGAPAGSQFRELLNATGLGNHPDMVRMFVKIGKSVGEDADFVPARTDTGAKTREEKYYGTRG